MPSLRCSFILLSIALCLSIQQRESSAFGWTQNFSGKVRKNPSRFQVASVTSTNLNKMRQRPGLEVIRLGASSSSSASIDDEDADNLTQQSPLNWWLKDPRNRSVSGILICTLERSTLNEFDMFHHVHGTFAAYSHWNFFSSFFSFSSRVYDGSGTVGKSNSIGVRFFLCNPASTLTYSHSFQRRRR